MEVINSTALTKILSKIKSKMNESKSLTVQMTNTSGNYLDLSKSVISVREYGKIYDISGKLCLAKAVPSGGDQMVCHISLPSHIKIGDQHFTRYFTLLTAQGDTALAWFGDSNDIAICNYYNGYIPAGTTLYIVGLTIVHE